jgi:phosphatidate cytidylyltransferase
MGDPAGPSVASAQPTPVLPGAIGAVLAGLVFLASWIGSIPLLVLTIAIAVMSLLELYAICLRKEIKLSLVPGIAGVVALPLAASWWGEAGVGVALGITIAALMALILVASRRSAFLATLSTTTLFVFYLGLTSSYLVLVRESSRGHRLVVILLLMIGGYHLGRWGGTLRLKGPTIVPSLSESPTWPAVAGAGITTLIAAQAGNLLLPLGITAMLGLGLVVGVAAAIGDLAGVLLVENLGVTKRESWVPGVGGLTSRLSTVLFAAPAWYFGLKLYLT